MIEWKKSRVSNKDRRQSLAASDLQDHEFGLEEIVARTCCRQRLWGLSAVIDDIVSLGKNMGLEVNNEDVGELLEDHKDELSTEELEQLQKQLQKAIVEEMSSEEE